MHLNNGIYFTMPDGKIWVNERHESRFGDLLDDSLGRLYELAGRLSVELCFENACNFHLPFVGRALERIARSHPGFRLTWDVGHDARTGYQEQPFILARAGQVRHMHLHDYDGVSDHRPLFSGSIPLADRVAFAFRQRLSVVIEVKTASSLKESVAKLKAHLDK